MLMCVFPKKRVIKKPLNSHNTVNPLLIKKPNILTFRSYNGVYSRSPVVIFRPFRQLLES